MFRDLVETPSLTLENGLALAVIVAQGLLKLVHCPHCGCAVIFSPDDPEEYKSCRDCQEDALRGATTSCVADKPMGRESPR
jgi:hypothetical protein